MWNHIWIAKYTYCVRTMITGWFHKIVWCNISFHEQTNKINETKYHLLQQLVDNWDSYAPSATFSCIARNNPILWAFCGSHCWILGALGCYIESSSSSRSGGPAFLAFFQLWSLLSEICIYWVVSRRCPFWSLGENLEIMGTGQMSFFYVPGGWWLATNVGQLIDLKREVCHTQLANPLPPLWPRAWNDQPFAGWLRVCPIILVLVAPRVRL